MERVSSLVLGPPTGLQPGAREPQGTWEVRGVRGSWRSAGRLRDLDGVSFIWISLSSPPYPSRGPVDPLPPPALSLVVVSRSGPTSSAPKHHNCDVRPLRPSLLGPSPLRPKEKIGLLGFHCPPAPASVPSPRGRCGVRPLQWLWVNPVPFGSRRSKTCVSKYHGNCSRQHFFVNSFVKGAHSS